MAVGLEFAIQHCVECGAAKFRLDSPKLRANAAWRRFAKFYIVEFYITQFRAAQAIGWRPRGDALAD
jgi:hypothetical protein